MAAIARHEVELNVGQAVRMPSLRKAAGLDIVGREDSLAAREILERRYRDAGQVGKRQAERPGAPGAHGDHAVDMVLQVLADTGQIENRRDADLPQLVRGADA